VKRREGTTWFRMSYCAGKEIRAVMGEGSKGRRFWHCSSISWRVKRNGGRKKKSETLAIAGTWSLGIGIKEVSKGTYYSPHPMI